MDNSMNELNIPETNEEISYIHCHGEHPHVHTNTKAVLNRMSRAIGHMESIKKMIEDGRDCSEVLIQNIRGNIFILRALVFGKQITQIPLADLSENQHRDDKNQ